MNGKSHQTIGHVTLVSFAVATFPSTELFDITIYPAVGLCLAAVGSKIADADMSQSEYGHKYPIVAKIFTHRGMTHTSIAVLLQLMLLKATGVTPNAVIQIIQSAFFGFILGYWMHLFADLHNGQGIPLLFPLIRKKISLMDIDLPDRNAKGIKKVVTDQEMFYTAGYCLLIIVHMIMSHMQYMIV